MTSPSPDDPGKSGGAHFVRSLQRGLTVITAFGDGADALTLSEVARKTGLTRAAARRFLLTLVDLGYMSTDGKRFSLRPRILDLGYSYLSGLSLPAIAEPHLEHLVSQTGESSSMAVLDGHDIIYVARVPTSRIMTVSINVGTRFPAYATSLGRVLLAAMPAEERRAWIADADLRELTAKTIVDKAALSAELDRVAARGWSLTDQELEHGLRSIAVPLRGPRGTVAAAINVSTQASRVSKETLRRKILPLLEEAAAAIQADLPSAGHVR